MAGSVRGEFSALMDCTDGDSQQEMLLKGDKFRERNRYSDILAFKHSRVHLVERDGDREQDPVLASYINANFIDGPLGELGNRKIIGCQGPKPNTVPDLWRMIVQENVTLIVSTCNTVEKGSQKCHRFWPSEEGEFEFAESTDLNSALGAYGIHVESSGPTVNFSEHLVMRRMKVSDSQLGIENREVRQLHYTGWPDHGVPSNESLHSFKKMFEIFTYMLLASDASEKAIVHCSAGIGRTGTTIALAHLLVQLYAQLNGEKRVRDPEISIFSTVRRLREQRYHLVQMPEQYDFIYSFLRSYLLEIKF